VPNDKQPAVSPASVVKRCKRCGALMPNALKRQQYCSVACAEPNNA
jgi:hypothetical protein